MYEQIGQLTRKMHDALRDLGYDKSLEKWQMPFPMPRTDWAILPP
jgi:chemotaxis protein CheZ